MHNEFGSYALMDYRQKFIHSLRGADRPRSAAVCGKLPDPRKYRRDSEMLHSIHMNLANQN